ncbi:hypothetical protein Psta_1128 [Pirellula staleyi DSM 6068]|uniref:DUF3987 domain-containing protein n=1 Tax=Pirellula staleyi (strain ATCC 27377 / DSM 6068 / ICPB 4128) TaxID=530564 RepID=D2R8Y3_PIRSD|nr:YfjI family protein [Pirellula staleyi]ADB15810.1 hypothetical protein Psta_1128 [Pirellula staleyi DSM 6068]
MSKVLPGEFTPFPLDGFPVSIQKALWNASKSIDCDVSFLGLPVLTAVAGVVGNRVMIECKPGFRTVPTLWSMIVGRSGSAKSPAIDFVMKWLRKRESTALYNRIRTAVAAKSQSPPKKPKKGEEAAPLPPVELPPPIPMNLDCERLLLDDITIETVYDEHAKSPSGLLLVHDEGHKFFAGMNRYAKSGGGSLDESKWLQLYDGRYAAIDRKTGNPRSVMIKQANVSITAGIQPKMLSLAVKPEYFGSGLVPRFLFAFPPARVRRSNDIPIEVDSVQAIEHLFRRLMDIRGKLADAPESLIVTLPEDVRRRYYEFTDELRESDPTDEDDMSACITKMECAVLRLALILHLVKWASAPGKSNPSTELSIEELDNAIELARWFKVQAERVYAYIAGNRSMDNDQKLLNMISKREHGMTAREVQQNASWLKNIEDTEKALHRLYEAKNLDKVLRTPRQGPVTTIYVATSATKDEGTAEIDGKCEYKSSDPPF